MRLLTVIAFIAALLAGAKVSAQPARGLDSLPKRNLVLGYINYVRSGQPYATELANLDYASVDIIAHAFGDPQADGAMLYPQHPLLNYRPTLLSQAHGRGKAVILSLFGDEEFDIIGSNATLRATFASNVVAGVQTYGYDGVDIDYEFPNNSTHKTNFTLLMQALHQRLKAAGTNYILTFYCSPGFYIGQYEWNQLGAWSDFSIYSGYGWENPAVAPLVNPGVTQFISGGGSIEGSMRGALDYMLSRGYPANKILAALPFYSSASQSWLNVRDTWVTNREFYATQIHPSWAEVEINAAWWNTPEALKRKCDSLLVPGQSVLTNGAILRGSAFWEFGHEAAAEPDLSLALGEWVTTNTVRLISPGNGAPSFVIGTPVPLGASAANPVGGLARIEFYAGSAKVAQATNAPWTANWTNAPHGVHALTARAVYAGGLVATSLAIEVTVRNPALQTLLARGSSWKFFDLTNVSTGWHQTNFNDVPWPGGPARLGYGGDGEATTIRFGGDPNNRLITSYFRRWFNVTNPALLTELVFQLSRDDGAAVYLNGREIFRSNLPDGPLTATTLASATVGGTDETNYFETVLLLAGAGLMTGSNLLAIELHQAATNSSDVGFDLQLVGAGTTEPRAYLAAPAPGATISLGTVIDAEAWAWAGQGTGVVRVEFLIDGVRAAEAWSPPWRSSWLATSVGTHSLVARVVPTAGVPIDSAAQTLIVTPVSAVTTQFIAASAVWKFLDNGSNQGTNWAQSAYNDSSWASGFARLGYGGDGEVTTVSYGGNTNNRYITTYFRRAFVAPPELDVTNLTCRLSRDDGAVVWLNGRELYRSNMPGGAISHTTLASATVSGTDETAFFTNSFATPALVPGTNLLAVEIHQAATNSSDLGFALELTGRGHIGRLRAPAPELDATFVAGGALQLAWPAVMTGWRVYSTTNVAASGASWLPLPVTPAVIAGWNVVTIPRTNDARFFRLANSP
jgi:hypothetical protein